jgi:hypothetical protein
MGRTFRTLSKCRFERFPAFERLLTAAKRDSHFDCHSSGTRKGLNGGPIFGKTTRQELAARDGAIYKTVPK